MADVEVWDVEVSADGGDQVGAEPGGVRVAVARPASRTGEDRRGRVGDSDMEVLAKVPDAPSDRADGRVGQDPAVDGPEWPQLSAATSLRGRDVVEDELAVVNVGVFYPQSLWVIEVVCSLCSCPKCSEVYSNTKSCYTTASDLI